MRGKRSKQYRKLMQQYGLTFGFREPYQVLVDVGMLREAVVTFKMDLLKMLHSTLHGEVKPMITQCTIRHIYNLATSTSLPVHPSSTPLSVAAPISSVDKTTILTTARTFEKRRCGHHELESPLSTLECVRSVVDPKNSQTNKHRYVLACQDQSVRDWARGVRGVPSVYVKRSVMILEPMASLSVDKRESTEREKLRAGVKRKRGEPREGSRKTDDVLAHAGDNGAEDEIVEKVKMERKVKGPKGPNPLSVKKPKKRVDEEDHLKDGDGGDKKGRKKRRRQHRGVLDQEAGVGQMDDAIAQVGP